MASILTSQIRSAAQESVLCWLASVDPDGQPNVTPKEAFALLDDDHVVVANIASPGSAKNIRYNPLVCLSFIDIFVQKGFKIKGVAVEYISSDEGYDNWLSPLRGIVGQRFPVNSIFVIQATSVEPIVAPSYWLYPETTTRESQVENALITYGVTRSR